MKLHMSFLKVLFVQPPQSYNHIIGFLEADHPGFYLSCIAHPNRDGCYQFTSLHTLFHHEACSKRALVAIKCNSMTRFSKEDSHTPWIGEVQHVKHKISTEQLLFRRCKTAWTSLGLDPHLKGIMVGMCGRRRRCLLFDFPHCCFKLQLSFLKYLLPLYHLLSQRGR